VPFEKSGRQRADKTSRQFVHWFDCGKEFITVNTYRANDNFADGGLVGSSGRALRELVAGPRNASVRIAMRARVMDA